MLPPLLRHLTSLSSAFTLFFALSPMAAQNPSGPSEGLSSGTFNIGLFNATSIQLFGLTDVEIIVDKKDGTGATPICVASNTTHYRMSLASPTNFKLKQGDNEINYNLSLLGTGQEPLVGAVWGSGQGQLASGAYSSVKIERDSTPEAAASASECDGSTHQIRVSTTDVASKPIGAYTDTVTVTVAPF